MGRRILQIHKMFNNKTPSYLNDKLPPKCRTLFSGNTRNTYREIICKSNRYMNSFFPDEISSWNIFIKHFDNVPRSHKFRHNFTDTPSEICHCNHGIEDTHH